MNQMIGNQSIQAACRDAYSSSAQQQASPREYGEKVLQDKPMLDVEYDRLERAALELDQSVQWLIQRIQPICQPACATKTAQGSQEPEAPRSEMRAKLQNLRSLVESISDRISEVRFSIEL